MFLSSCHGYKYSTVRYSGKLSREEYVLEDYRVSYVEDTEMKMQYCSSP